MSRIWIYFAILLLLMPIPTNAQQQLPQPTTTLAGSSAMLQLPGSLTLTSTVTPPAATGGMPSGTVQFFSNTNTSIGSATLTAIPSTEGFTAPGISSSQGNDVFGIFALPSGTPNYSAVGVLGGTYAQDTYEFTPQLTIYTGQGSNLFSKASTPYPIGAAGYQSPVSFAVADFTHDGALDVLLVSGGNYYVLPGSSTATFNSAQIVSADKSGLNCDCSNPTELVAIDDFDGDGYPDVAYAGTDEDENRLIGATLNDGAQGPAQFSKEFIAAPTVTIPGSQIQFSPQAITTGHFTTSGHADLLAAGFFESTVSAGELALFPGNGDGTFATPKLFTTTASPVAIATGDLRQSGKTDVVVANVGFVDSAVTMQVFFGDGAGNLAVSSTPTYCPLTSVGEGTETVSSLLLQDFNNDGFPDILGTGTYGSLCLMLNDGKGSFANGIAVGQSQLTSSLTTAADFNGDGLADIVEFTNNTYYYDDVTSTASEYINSASAQAILTTASHTIPAGADTLTATLQANANFSASTSNEVPITVTQSPSTITWAQPATIEYGVALGASQLNATASVPAAITYSPTAGTVLPPGANNVTATLVPTDNFDYAGATKTQVVTVAAPTLTGISPASTDLGADNTTITVTGQGFINGAVVRWNSTALATTWVSLNQLTAVVLASLLTSSTTNTISVADPNSVAVAGSATFSILAPKAVATANANATAVDAGGNGTLTLTVDPYPATITATLSLTFVPDAPNTLTDPTVTFTSGATTETVQIPANSSAAIPPITFSAGSTAGTIDIAIALNAGGVDITPADLQTAVPVSVPAAAPMIESVTVTRSGQTLTLNILGLSTTRDMSQAQFHFTPATGKSLSTTDLTVDVSTEFSGWYAETQSDQYGTTFLYTQPFTLSSDAANVGTISVTLQNSKGTSVAVTAQ